MLNIKIRDKEITWNVGPRPIPIEKEDLEAMTEDEKVVIEASGSEVKFAITALLLLQRSMDVALQMEAAMEAATEADIAKAVGGGSVN